MMPAGCEWAHCAATSPLKHKRNIIAPFNSFECWCAAGVPSCCLPVLRSLTTRLSAVIRGREETSAVIREGRGQQPAKWSHGAPGGLRGLGGRVVNTWCTTCGFMNEWVQDCYTWRNENRTTRLIKYIIKLHTISDFTNNTVPKKRRFQD